MDRGVGSLEQTDRDSRVELRGRQACVARDLLEHADVGAVLPHRRGHRVAQQVTGPVLYWALASASGELTPPSV